jgi:hypothetical protein
MHTTDLLFDTLREEVRAPCLPEPDVDEELIARLCGLCTTLPADSGDLADVLAPAEAPDEIGSIGPYGILRVLGRGGMGIVFAARQDRPRRVVALKMLNTSASHSGERLERFRAESDTLARLNHPQIIRILAVGEHQGRPYFTTELAEGGSLAQKLTQATLPPREAAKLVEGLAHTVAAAHAQGIIHRDLKPSNVLLAGDGRPLVADFGLAKQLEGLDSVLASQTETGVILGTPSYMAPEQAAGQNQLIGPAADVYALGAILYECLTGRPPFKAATSLETLEQVRSHEPVPPRRLQPTVGRDLETICLKCLQKLPRERYPDAAALADDLQCWCEGRPIRARRAGAVERLLKWARRRPALAALSAVCVLLLAGLLGGATLYERRLRAALDDTAQQKERAAANYREARAALQQVLARAGARNNSDVPRLRELQREQQEDALAFFLKIAEQQSDDPEVRLDTAQAALDVGILQNTLGRKQDAVVNLQRARAALAVLAADFPQRPRFRYEHVRSLLTLVASGLLSGDQERAYLDEALAQTDALLAQEPEHLDYRAAKAVIHLQLGTRHHLNRDPAAEHHLTAAADLWQELGRAQPQERRHRLMLADTLANLSLNQQQHGGDPQEAHDRAEAVLEQLHREQPSDDGALSSLTALRVNWAYVQINQGKADAALEAMTANVQVLEAALRAEPGHVMFRDRLLRSHALRAEILERQQRFADALPDRQQGVTLSPSVAAADFKRLFLALTQVRAKQHAAAAAVLDDWTTRMTPQTPPEEVLHAVAVYCHAVTAAREDQGLTAADREACVERYGKQAVALLVRLQERSYFRDAAHAHELTTDPDLLPLRGRADFGRLLSRVKTDVK